MSLSNKLMRARCRLLQVHPFYGSICMQIKWTPSEMEWMPEGQMKTMGVRILSSGEIECLYHEEFVERLSLEELFAVIQHEAEHIVRCHCLRIYDREPQRWNIACDMTVNGRKDNPRIGFDQGSASQKVIPDKDHLVWIPKDWEENGTAEQYYNKLPQMRQLSVQMPGGIDNGSQSKDGKGGKGDKDKGKGGKDPTDPSSWGKMMDDHSVWNQTEVSADEARQIIKDVVREAVSHAQGNVPGHLEAAIAELNKPVVNWRQALRQYTGKHLGKHRETFSRRHRRIDEFGMPGKTYRGSASANVIVDTSGSVSQKLLEQFFAEIDSISHRTKVWVLQWDHAFQGYDKYRRNDWKNFKVNGRGGTDMAAPVKWLMDNKRIADVQIMLTDGYCNYLDAQPFPMITVISTDQPGPGWGHEVHIKVAE